MKPTITFDKTAAKYMLRIFNKFYDKNGYIRDSKTHIIQFCGMCKKPIHINHFAGIVKNIGLICDNTCCLISINDLKK